MLETTTIYVAPASRQRHHGSGGGGGGGGGTVSKADFWMLRLAVALASSTLAIATPSSAEEQLHADSSSSSSSIGGGDPVVLAAAAHVNSADGSNGGTVAQALASAEGNAAALSLLESLLASLNALLAEYGLPSAPVLCAALAVSILALTFAGKVGFGGGGGGGVGGGSAKKQRKGVVLFLGPCGSGKTAMCYRLCNDRLAPTVTSMQPCRYACGGLTPGGKASASLVDYPGHERLRGGVREELRRADRVVFVLDGSCLGAQIAAGAELLYDVLTDPAMEGCRGLMLALNKSDVKEAKASRVKTLMQKELEKLRGTRGTLGTQGEEDDMPVAMALGRPGQPFSLEVDSPCEVVIASCSVARDGGLEPVAEFVRASVR